ncbi:MAG TPA: aminoglycoside phosphotransferase [Nocardioides sp.]|nr:aminoglycoside phosphotransferase [Nocardioides sp.]
MHTLAELLATDDVAGALEDLGVDPDGAVVEPVGYPFGSPATAALYRVRSNGRSFFVKALQHVKHWPALAFMPPHIVDDFVAQFPWRSELDLWEPWEVATMPAGLRPPVLHRLVEMPDERASVWMEDVVECAEGWDLDRYRRAAYLLGRWNARSTDPDLLARCPHTERNFALRMYATNAVAFRGLVPLGNDELWTHPWLTDHAELRADLLALAPDIPAMLDRMDTYVQCVPHGDASPQNLLVPADDPETFVVIDISFRTPHALGFDLGQLLVGLTHAGDVPAARLPEVAATIVSAYLEGLHDEGVVDQDAQARDAFATGVMLRSGFDGFLYELLEESDPAQRHAFDERVEMSRMLVDLYRSTR